MVLWSKSVDKILQTTLTNQPSVQSSKYIFWIRLSRKLNCETGLLYQVRIQLLCCLKHVLQFVKVTYSRQINQKVCLSFRLPDDSDNEFQLRPTSTPRTFTTSPSSLETGLSSTSRSSESQPRKLFGPRKVSTNHSPGNYYKMSQSHFTYTASDQLS